MSSLIVNELRKSYRTQTEELSVLDGISFELKPGDNLSVMGPSGSGKSTLLQILGTLDTPTSGSVSLDGVDPFSMPQQQLAAFRNSKIGFVFQDHHLLPQLSILDNLLLPVLATGRPTQEYVDRARLLVDRIGLSGRIHHLPSELSGGERERTAVARALMMKPSLILADEPTGNLDQSNAQRIADLLIELQKQENAILIVVTHSHELAARLDRRVRLDRGRMVEDK
jgi:lipoprotein-releasing system ATP-binding protein